MLKELEIENLAIIKKSVIDFAKGFNVITGETGAGKSIILNALGLLLGQKANLDIIRSNENECKIQAIFDLSLLPQNIVDSLPDIAKGKELIISRIIGKDRAKVYINGILSNLITLESITTKIISFCGQNQQADLLNSKYHLEILDKYSNLDEEKKEYKKLFDEYKKLERELKIYLERKNEIALRVAELSAIKEDLEKIKLTPNRRFALENEIKKLTETENIQNISTEIADLLLSNSGIFSMFGVISRDLNKITKYDSSVEKFENDFKEILNLTTEFEREYNQYIGSLNVDDDYLEELREELSLIATLERKYVTNHTGLIDIYEKVLKELSEIKTFEDISKQEMLLKVKKEKLIEKAIKLSSERKKYAKKFENSVIQELSELNLQNVNFVVLFNKTEVDEFGVDDVEFIISLNKGYEPKPLKKIASYGELSRILLVLKKIIKDKFGVNILIFDEVDSGMSGKSARAVGEKLKALATTSQVICITHLPQVASLADAHYIVSKEGKDKIFTQIRRIDKNEQIEEIARMLAGYKITESAKASARELMTS